MLLVERGGRKGGRGKKEGHEEKEKEKEKEEERRAQRKYLRAKARAHNARARDKEIIRGQVATGMLRIRYQSDQAGRSRKISFRCCCYLSVRFRDCLSARVKAAGASVKRVLFETVVVSGVRGLFNAYFVSGARESS